MKKLLSIFGAFALLAGTTTSVIACGNSTSRFDNGTIADKLKDLIIAEIANNPKYGKYTFGDLYNNTSTLNNLASELINREIGQYFTDQTQALWAVWAKAKPSSDNGNVYQKLIMSLAIDQFYRDYLSAFASDTFLETKIIDGDYNVVDNAINLPSESTITPAFLPWKIANVQYYTADYTNYDKDKSIKYTPNPVASDNSESYNQIKQQLTDPDKTKINTLKNGMAFEFSDYIIHVEVQKILKNIISQTYLNKTLFNTTFVKSTQHVYTNPYAPLMSSMMTWTGGAPTPSDIHSNFKMVYEYKIQYNQDEIDRINGAITTDTTGDKITLGSGWTPTKFTDLANTLFPSSLKNYNYDGGDPVFNVNHFKGFAAYDNTGSLVNGGKYDPYADPLKQASKAGFLRSSSKYDVYNFNDNATNPKFATFAFVLPIYLPDILNNAEINFGGADKMKKIELVNYNNTTSGNPDSLAWGGSVLGAENGRSVKYLLNYKNNTGGKPLGTWGTYAADGTTTMFTADGNINPNVATDNFQLLQWAQNAYAQASNISQIAKTNLYSIAFDYNPDNIYSNNLYNAIGQYIEKKPN